MALRTNRYSFVKTATAWEVSQAWRQRRRAMAQRFLDDAATAANAFTSAWSNQISGSASLAAQSALDRLNAATATRRVDTSA